MWDLIVPVPDHCLSFLLCTLIRQFWFISDSDSDSDTDFYLALLARGNLSFILYNLQQVSLTIYRVGCVDIPTPDAKTI